MNDDMTLVREFAASHSETAFAELAERHVGLVHSAALRQTGDPHLAGEITQAVFIILARKAGSLGAKTVLSAWLYQTTRYAAADALKIRRRRQAREQEAYMQSTLNESPDAHAETEAWTQLAPLLDDALACLGETDRTALVLRYFENKSAREIATALRIGEAAAQKRVVRALEKLRARFVKRGVGLTAAAIAGAVAANSVQAAPAGMTLAATVAGMKGAGTGASTLTVKGALKIMAWTKLKTAAVVGLGLLLAAGTTTLTIEKIQEYRGYPWQVRNCNSDVLRNVPPQVKIATAKYPGSMGAGLLYMDRGQRLGIAQSAAVILEAIYGQSAARTIFSDQAPPGKYDFIANLPSGNGAALQKECQREFGLVGRHETRETDVLSLKLQDSSAPDLKPADPRGLKPADGNSSIRYGPGLFTARNVNLSSLAWYLEDRFAAPVIDQTGLTNLYDINLEWEEAAFPHPDPENVKNIKKALLEQLGLVLVPGREAIDMLIVEKVK